jgi:hypothetical protein
MKRCAIAGSARQVPEPLIFPSWLPAGVLRPGQQIGQPQGGERRSAKRTAVQTCAPAAPGVGMSCWTFCHERDKQTIIHVTARDEMFYIRTCGTTSEQRHPRMLPHRFQEWSGPPLRPDPPSDVLARRSPPGAAPVNIWARAPGSEHEHRRGGDPRSDVHASPLRLRTGAPFGLFASLRHLARLTSRSQSQPLPASFIPNRTYSRWVCCCGRC